MATDNRLRNLQRKIAVETGDATALNAANIPTDLAFKERGLSRISSALDNNPLAKGKILNRLQNAGPAVIRDAALKLGVDADRPDPDVISTLSNRLDRLQSPDKLQGADRIRQKLVDQSIEQQLIENDAEGIQAQAASQISGTPQQNIQQVQAPQQQRKSSSVTLDALTSLLSGLSGTGKTIADKISTAPKTVSATRKPKDEIEAFKQEYDKVVPHLTSVQAKQYKDSELRNKAISALEQGGQLLDEDNITEAMRQLNEQFEGFK